MGRQKTGQSCMHDLHYSITMTREISINWDSCARIIGVSYASVEDTRGGRACILILILNVQSVAPCTLSGPLIQDFINLCLT